MPTEPDLDLRDWDVWFETLLAEAVIDAAKDMTEEQLAALDEKLDAILPDVVLRSSDDVAATIVDGLKNDAAAMLAHRREFHAAVATELRRYWGEAFDLTEMFIKAAGEIAEFFYAKHLPSDGVHDYVFEALGRLTARACRISEEILVLLKAGYGQGGMARWRALHEVAVIATFIQENGDACAERYFKHEAVESWRAAKEFQRHAAALGAEPTTPEVMASLEEEYDAVIAEYGPQFAGHHGWAYDALRTNDAKAEANFPTIEKRAGLDHFRPYYRLASHPSHAKAKGITIDPDSPRGDRGAVLLTGPGPAGLADPGRLTAISLVQVVSAFLNSNPASATPLLVGILLRFSEEAGVAYLAAHEAVESQVYGDTSS